MNSYIMSGLLGDGGFTESASKWARAAVMMNGGAGADMHEFGRALYDYNKDNGELFKDIKTAAPDAVMSAAGELTSESGTVDTALKAAAGTLAAKYGILATAGTRVAGDLYQDAKKKDWEGMTKHVAETGISYAGAALGPVGELGAAGANLLIEGGDFLYHKREKEVHETKASKSNTYAEKSINTRVS